MLFNYKSSNQKAMITLEKAREMKKDASLIKLAEAVFKAMSYEAIVASIIKPKQQEVIDFYRFEVDNQWIEKYGIKDRFIKDIGQMYLSSEEDFDIYQKEMDKFYVESGVKPSKEGNCPLLEAESLTCETKKCFIDALEKYTGIKRDSLFSLGDVVQTFNRYVDLNLEFLADVVEKEIKKVA